MTHSDLAKFAEAFLAEMHSVLVRKNRDYAGSDNDALEGLKSPADRAGILARQAWKVFTEKHWRAIEKWVKTGTLESEGIRGRFLDLANYALLGAALAAECEKQESK